MLRLEVGGTELYDEESSTFRTENSVEIELEHSLVSLSKWESHFEKPFLATTDKTNDEVLWYIHAMILTPGITPDIVQLLSSAQFMQINRYINAKMTATWFLEQKNQPPNREVVTAEIVYYWMISLNIPLECETWHFNKLMTLIKVCNEKNNPNKKKMSQADIARRNRELNAQRRAAAGTTG